MDQARASLSNLDNIDPKIVQKLHTNRLIVENVTAKVMACVDGARSVVNPVADKATAQIFGLTHWNKTASTNRKGRSVLAVDCGDEIHS